MRIDKYLWAIRVFKTRSEATDACNGGKVKIAGVNAKPSKNIQVSDVIEVRKGSAIFSWRVLQLTENRMGAALVPQYAEDLTPESERARMRPPRETLTIVREKGSGRPTKRDRRILDSLMGDLYEDE